MAGVYYSVYRLACEAAPGLDAVDVAEHGVRTRGLPSGTLALLGFFPRSADSASGRPTMGDLQKFLVGRGPLRRGEVVVVLRRTPRGRGIELLALAHAHDRLAYLHGSGARLAEAYLACADVARMASAAGSVVPARDLSRALLDLVETVTRKDLGRSALDLLATAREYLQGKVSASRVLEALGEESSKQLGAIPLEPQFLAAGAVHQVVSLLPTREDLDAAIRADWLALPLELMFYESLRLLGGVPARVEFREVLVPRGSAWLWGAYTHMHDQEVLRALARALAKVLPLGKALLLGTKKVGVSGKKGGQGCPGAT